MTDVRVQFLGTGDPFAPGGRLQTCILVESGDARILLDCGATALVGLARAGIDPATIDAVLLTHLHGDHFGGLPFLILESRLNPDGRAGAWKRRPLRIAGPAETEARVGQVTKAFGYDNYVTPEWSTQMLEFIPLEARRATVIGPATVTAFPVPHTPEATALRVSIGGKTIAYSGDSGWSDTLLEASADADLFICVAYTFESPTSLISYRTLQEQRHRLTCRRLILTHLGAEMQQRLSDTSEAIAEDGMTITL
jgi:ribonuclease BN (tRNA processing enzyme)